MDRVTGAVEARCGALQTSGYQQALEERLDYFEQVRLLYVAATRARRELVGLALGASALFGTRYSILGRPWPTIRRILELGPPKEPEPEYGPRFAQAKYGMAVSQARRPGWPSSAVFV